MSGPPFDLMTSLRRGASAWQAFFFTPVSTWPCAWVRIGYAILVLINAACWYPDLQRWYGREGILSSETLTLIQSNYRWTLLTLLPGDDVTLQVVFWLLVASAVCLLVGLGSRVSAACVLVGLISFHNRNPIILDAEDMLLRLMGWYVLAMPCGRALALDRWLWRREPIVGADVYPVWGLRLLQINVALIFVTAAWHKLQGETWRDGSALYYVSRLDDYFGRFPVWDWPWDTPWVVRGMTWSVILIELLVPVFVWFRQTRRWALLLALLFHLGNEYFMNLYLFHWGMLVGWSAFLLPEDFWLHRGASATENVAVTPEATRQAASLVSASAGSNIA